MSASPPPPERPPQFLDGPDSRRIAYHKIHGREPGLLFLGGFMSDMTGAKASALERFAAGRGQAFVRFDYQGHGRSSGRFEDGTIGLWAEDAVLVLDRLAAGRQVLVGSSMGGWIMLLAALARPERIAALVGIAPAPDFTEALLWDALGPDQRERLARDGAIAEPSAYSETPYRITRALIEEGRRHLLLGAPIPLACPVRLLHGLADPDVPWETSLQLMRALDSDDVEVTLVKSGDHRLSAPQDLERLCAVLAGLLDAWAG